MAITLEELQIKFNADMGNLNSELKGIKAAMGGVEAPANKATSAMAGFAKIGGMLAAAGIGAKLISIGKESLKMANDAAESESLFAVSMGDMADDARAWSEEMSSALGVNAYAARKNVGVLNTMFKSMGLGKKPAADMAKQLTALSEDMASFYNLDPTEAFTKLQAGITGEAEGLKRLGILVDETTVKQYALRTGMIKQGEEMTNQQKVAARYGAIMEQTSDAQGDLARTMESPTNQLRKLTNEFDMAKIALGTALQPALLAVIPVLTSLADGATNAIKALSGIGSSDGLDNVLITVDKARQMAAEVVGTGFKDIADKIDKASKETDAAIANFETTEKATKSVLLDISFNPPTVSGYEQVLTKMAQLKTDIFALEGSVTKYIDTYLTPMLQEGEITQNEYNRRVALLQKRLDTLKYNAEKLQSKVDAKIAAAMEDQEVTLKEKTAILKAIEDEVNKATKDMTAAANAMKTQIAADLRAKKITPEESKAAVALVDAELADALAGMTATADALKATVGIGDWNAITLSQSQTDDLADKITATIEASNVVVSATIDEVKAEFTETGALGLVVGTLYQRLGEKITDQNKLIAEKVAGWTSGLMPTQAQVAEVIAAAAERDRLLAMLSPELGIAGTVTANLGDLTLDAQSIKNYFSALSSAVTTESESAAATFEKQKIRLANAAGMPEWDMVLAEYGLAGMSYDAAVKALYAQMLASLSGKESAAVMAAAEKILPSVQAAMEGEGIVAKIDATYDLQSFISGLNIDKLDAAAKKALLEMLLNMRIPTESAYTNVFGGGNPFQTEIDALIQSLGGSGAVAGKEMTDNLRKALEEGAIDRSEYDQIIGASASKQALAQLAISMAAGGNKSTSDFITGLLRQQLGVTAAAMLLAQVAQGGLNLDTSLHGRNFGQGFVDGINEKLEAAQAAGKKLANAARAALTTTLQEQSPSKVTRQSGEYFGEGFAIGIDNTADRVYKTSQSLALGAVSGLQGAGAFGLDVGGEFAGGENDMAGAIETGIERGIQRVMDSLNITLKVDGNELGRASIRGINNVTRASGKMLLEF